MKTLYKPTDLRVATFHGCTADMKTEFETWVRSLTLELDNEPGDAEDGTWSWVLEAEAVFEGAKPFDTFIFSEVSTGKILAHGELRSR